MELPERAERFLLQLEKDLKANLQPKQQLETFAWTWFDSQAFISEHEQLILQRLYEHFGQPEGPQQRYRFSELQDRKLYPMKGWLADYMDYASFVGAPWPFHFFTGVATLGAALRRDSWIPFGRSHTFPSTYIILVAPPGLCYKSTAIDVGTALLRESTITTIISGRATPEAVSNMISTLKEAEPIDAIAFISAPEFYRFLAGHNIMMNYHVIAALTSWYDAQEFDDDVTITREHRVLHNIAITLLGGSTLEWLVEALPREVFAGGFMSRIMFIFQECTNRDWVVCPSPDELKKQRLLEQLDIVRELKGPKSFDVNALTYYTEYRNAHKQALMKMEERAADFRIRREEQVRKLALIFSASLHQSSITLECVEQAVSIVKLLEKPMEAVIAPLSLGESGKEIDTVRRLVERYREISRTDLCRMCAARGLDVQRLDRALETLNVAGLIQTITAGKKGGRIYKWIKR